MTIPNELQNAINNDQVTYEIFKKYSNFSFSNVNIHFKCEHCNKEYTNLWHNFKNNNYKEILCYKCRHYKTLSEKLNIPDDLIWYGTKENPFLFEHYLKYREQIASNKRFVKGTCKICGKPFIARWNNLLRRQYTTLDEVGQCCLNKYKSNLPEILKKNSEAQKIAQNRPEVIQKQRIAQAKAMANDPTLIDKKMAQNNRLRGYYNNIYFSSSFELAFLLQIPNAQKCNLKISYIWKNELHNYYPDYIYTNTDNSKIIIVELKGSYFDKERIQLKKIAAEQFIQDHSNNYSHYESLDRSNFETILNKPFIYINSWSKLIKYKHIYNSLIIQSISETMLKQSNFSTKQEAIDYINSL